MTALPLVWGEGDVADVVQGRSGRSGVLLAIDTKFDVDPIDTLSAKALGRHVAIIAQPRRLTPDELVAFDKWVRRGGRAMIFIDPELLWPSRHPPGDSRRAPPVELLDPLLAHWGIALGHSDGQERIVLIGKMPVAMQAAGAFTGPKNCRAVVAELFHCRIGQGRVVLVADADVLGDQRQKTGMPINHAWILQQLVELDGTLQIH